MARPHKPSETKTLTFLQRCSEIVSQLGMSNSSRLGMIKASNPKVWILVGVGIAGLVILAETQRRRRKRKMMLIRAEDFGAFVERFQILPFPQAPPPASRQSLAGLTFAIKDMLVSSLLFNCCLFSQ